MRSLLMARGGFAPCAAFIVAWSVAVPARRSAGMDWFPLRVAQAQPATAKAEARAKLQRGAQLLQQGEFAQALAEFKEAYALVPSPKIYFNFGIAYVGLARYSEALESFERFTQEAKDASPGNLADARQQIENLTGKVEKVRVSSDRDGADVSIDGRSYGLTPLAHPIYVDPGAHQLVVQDHDRPLIQNFTAFAGKEGALVVSFKAAAAKTEPVAATPNLGPPPPPERSTTAAGGTPTGATPEDGRDTGSPEDRRTLHRRLRVASVVGAGVGLAAGVTGFVLRGVATQKLNTIQNDAAAGRPYDPANGNYHTFDSAGVGLMVGGGALIGASLITYLLNRDGAPAQESATVSLQASGLGQGQSQFGLLVSGSY